MNPPRPQKVLMTADCVGGVWTYSLQLTQALASHGVEVTLVVMGGELSPDQVHEAEQIPNLRLIASDLKLEWMPDPEADLRCADELLLEIEAMVRPDIVHVNGYANAAAGFQAPVLVVAHSCVTSWFRACRNSAPTPDWRGYEERLRAGVAAADLLVAPTGAYLDMFARMHGAPPRSRVILNGRDAASCGPGLKQNLVLAAGRMWDEAKNVRTLCEAAEYVPYPVLIAGEGDAPEGTPANVSMLGRLAPSMLAARMAEAAVFASPARYEPFGLAILEAALSGCALVLGDIPTLRELWDDAARFVAPDDPGALATEIDRLLSDPGRARRAGQEARRRALRFGAGAMGRNYLDAYGGLIAARASHAEAAAA